MREIRLLYMSNEVGPLAEVTNVGLMVGVCVCVCVRAFQCLSSRYWFNQLPLSCYTDTEAVCRDQNCTAWPKVRQSVCIIFTPRRGDERVCLSVFVCLSAIISLELHVRSSPIFC